MSPRQLSASPEEKRGGLGPYWQASRLMELQVRSLHTIGGSFWFLLEPPPDPLNNPNLAKVGVLRANRRMTKPFVSL